MANKTATYSIQFKSNVAETANEDADSLEALQRRMQSHQDAIKTLQASQRSLKGSSDEVKDARKALKAQIEAEQGAMTKLQLGLLKQGTSYEQLASAAKKSQAAQKEGTSAISAAGGPIASLRDRMSSLKDAIDGAGGGAGLAKLAFFGLAAAVVAVTAAVTAGVVSLSRWVLETANAQRTAGLFREAALGSAQGAKNLGDQIDALSKKVSTPKEKINELAVSLSKMRLSGAAIVDTLNAVTQASDAMGDDVGSKLKDILTRGQMTGTAGLNPLELLGTNLDFSDVSKAVASEMRVTVKEAQTALLTGRAPIEAAAKGIRKAVEKQFGEINARKMLDLNVQAQKFRETLGTLTKDVKLEPILKGLDELRKLFDANSTTGAGLKVLVDLLGNALGKTFQTALPIGKAALQGFVIGVLSTVIAVRKMKKAFDDAFGDKQLIGDLDLATAALKGTEYAVYAVAAGLAVTAAAIGAVVAAGSALYDTFTDVYDAVASAGEKLASLDWREIGRNLVDGLIKGITSAALPLPGLVGGLADTITGAFKDKLQIHSPSRVFEGFGENTVEGYAQGVDNAAPRAQGAVDAMAPSSPVSTAASSAPRQGATMAVTIPITVYAGPGTSGEDVAKAVSSPSVIAQFTKVLEDVLGSGEVVPT